MIANLDAIAERMEVAWRERRFLSYVLYSDVLDLIAEVRKLRAQLYDAGLPDASDFPNQYGGKL